jgi:hypothetical protein
MGRRRGEEKKDKQWRRGECSKSNMSRIGEGIERERRR